MELSIEDSNMDLIGNMYKQLKDDSYWVLSGILIAEDDNYWLMYNERDKEYQMLSYVLDIDHYDFDLVD